MRLISTTLAGPGSETIIGDALRSVAPLVEGYLVIDTANPPWAPPPASPNEEPPLYDAVSEACDVIAYGGAPISLLWKAWPWQNDFAAARNISLLWSFADWAVMVDTDERILCPDPTAVRDFLEALPPAVEVVVVQAADGSHGRERFFRLPAHHRWIGRTHEAFPVDHGQQATIPPPLISWTELPKTAEQIRAKAERDAGLLALEVREHPEDPRWRLYLGIALQTLGRSDEAIAQYIAASMRGYGEDSVFACFAAADLLVGLRRFDEALVAAARGMALDATFGELPWIAGVAAMELGRPDQALAWARLAEVHGATGEGRKALERRVGHRSAAGLTTGPPRLLRAALGALGERAAAASQAALEARRDQAHEAMGIGACAGDVAISGERHVLELVRQRAPDGPIVVWDVGANRGQYARLALEMLGERAALLCFEPNREAVRAWGPESISATLRARSSPHRVEILPLALSNANGVGALYSDAPGSALSSLHPRPFLRGVGDIQTRRLDQVAHDRGAERIDLLKIDVEGHEMHVLRGAQEMIERGAIGAIQFEFGGANIDSRTFLRDFFDLLSPRYALHRVTPDGLVPVEYHERHEVFVTTNFLALSRARETPRPRRTFAIIFSKDRPLQLDACLRSLRMHCSDIEALSIHVIVLATTPTMGAAYDELIAATPWATFHPQRDFEADVRALLGECDHVLFVVDDTIFVRPISVAEMVSVLDDDPSAIGVSLRLGANTTYCYPTAREQRVPEFELVAPTGPWWKCWLWSDADGDFGYPLELSSSLYRANEILSLLSGQRFANPNLLEAVLASAAGTHFVTLGSPRLLCAPLSLAFSNPCNKVQSTFCNRSGSVEALSPEALLGVWQRGGRVDVGAYAGHTPHACHEEVPIFLQSPRAELVERPVRITVTSTAVRAADSAGRCVRSVREQSFAAWSHVYYAGDLDTWSAAKAELAPERTTLRWNSSAEVFPPLLANLLPVWRSLPDDEVIVWLDGDDWLAHDSALQIVADAHRRGALATYGQFIWGDGTIGFAAPVGPDPRSEPWRTTHLKTFRAGLVKRIRETDLRREDGAYLDLAIDQAIMLACVEMARERAVFIPQVLMVYNNAHSFAENASEAEKARELHEVGRIRRFQRYARADWPTG